MARVTYPNAELRRFCVTNDSSGQARDNVIICRWIVAVHGQTLSWHFATSKPTANEIGRPGLHVRVIKTDRIWGTASSVTVYQWRVATRYAWNLAAYGETCPRQLSTFCDLLYCPIVRYTILSHVLKTVYKNCSYFGLVLLDDSDLFI